MVICSNNSDISFSQGIYVDSWWQPPPRRGAHHPCFVELPTYMKIQHYLTSALLYKPKPI